MKTKILPLLLLLANTITAQLTITPGAQFSIVNNATLTLQNTDLVNNGNFLVSTTSPVSFTGNASSFIGGDGAIRFLNLEIKKTGDQSVSLQKAISVGSGVFFTSGFLNLNGFDLDLETTGHLDGEREDSRVIGPNGGNVVFSTNLNAPTGSNPANLRIIITSDQNLGNVIIKRGHQSQVNNASSGNSILRYYDIFPLNNTSLNATLRLNYFDGELNANNENSLALFKSDDGVNWSNQGFTSIDANANFVERTGISSFSRWTLFSDNNVLPVRFIAFNASCKGDNVELTWKTAQEQNSSHFKVEKSEDGIRWTAIGNQPAAGNSASERIYSFTVNQPVQNSFYRIAEYDVNGRVQYTNVIHSSCIVTDLFTLWPNPTHDVVFINIVGANESEGLIKVFDSKGALVNVQKTAISRGSNLIRVDMKSKPIGVYSLAVYWDNGQSKKTIQVIRQ